MRHYFMLFLSIAVMGGCSASADPGAVSTGDSDLTQDQKGLDVQVLQAWTAGRLLPANNPPLGKYPGDVQLNASDETVCPTRSTLPSVSGYVDRSVDCNAAFTAATPLDGKTTGPSITDVTFTISTQTSNPSYSYVDPDYCNTVELRAVVRDAAIAQSTFAGVGFWTSRGEHFVAKADLQGVGHVTLLTGDAATVYRFNGISTCISSAHNSTSGNIYQTFSFKPYVAYDTPADDGSTTRYRVWDSAKANYALGKSYPGETPIVNSDSFDRQEELLQK